MNTESEITVTTLPLRQIETFPISALTPSARNARTHSRKQVKQIAASIEEFGFTNPVLIDDENTILAGHGRIEAAKMLKMADVPCVRLSNLSTTQKRAYLLADNKLALNAGWDEEILADELQALAEIDPGFDLGITGFSIPEIDTLMEGRVPEEDGDPRDDDLTDAVRGESLCREGDIWQLGRNRLICGNALDPMVVDDLMDGELARMVFADPPYNVQIDGHVCGSGAIKHREFAMASGEMSPEAFTAFLKTSFENLARVSMDGAIHYICMDWRHMPEVMNAAEGVYHEFKNLIVWVKDNAGMGTFYRSRHELIFAFKVGKDEHTNSFELGQHGRYRTNVWEYRGVNSRHAGRMEELAMHPTVKPVQMIADAIKDVSGRGEAVLDLFGGSGSTLIAAEKTGRRAFIAEIDPLYCDVIIRRWEAYAKDDAVKLRCGLLNKQGMAA